MHEIGAPEGRASQICTLEDGATQVCAIEISPRKPRISEIDADSDTAAGAEADELPLLEGGGRNAQVVFVKIGWPAVPAVRADPFLRKAQFLTDKVGPSSCFRRGIQNTALQRRRRNAQIIDIDIGQDRAPEGRAVQSRALKVGAVEIRVRKDCILQIGVPQTDAAH